MKQRLRLTCLLFALCSLLFSLLLTSCGEEAAAAVTDTIVTITFDSNGGSKVEPVQLEKGGKLSTPYLTGNKVPKFTGNRFVGWFDGSTQVSKETTFSKSTTLTAQWVLQITVSFSMGEGVTDPAPPRVTIDAGTALGSKYPIPTRPGGWEFKGWFTNGTKYTDSTVITSESSTFTLTAEWEKEIEQPLEYAEAAAIHPGRHLAEVYPAGLTVKAGVEFTIQGLSSNVEKGGGVLSAQWYRATTPPEENNYVGEAVGIPLAPKPNENPNELSVKLENAVEPEAGNFWYWVVVTNYNEKATKEKYAYTPTMNQLKVTVTESESVPGPVTDE